MRSVPFPMSRRFPRAQDDSGIRKELAMRNVLLLVHEDAGQEARLQAALEEALGGIVRAGGRLLGSPWLDRCQRGCSPLCGRGR